LGTISRCGSSPRSLERRRLAASPENVANALIGRLEQAWNEADGRAFGEPFSADADFVDIRGEYHQGQEAITAGHQAIFDSIYKDSSTNYKLIQARELSDDVILAHTTGVLRVPSGPLGGEHSAVQSLVLVREDDEWRIAGFHNTPVAQRRQ
jgi:uncharacterized protein (TIGR02246 family)